jgi:hypothetical protein
MHLHGGMGRGRPKCAPLAYMGDRAGREKKVLVADDTTLAHVVHVTVCHVTSHAHTALFVHPLKSANVCT